MLRPLIVSLFATILSALPAFACKCRVAPFEEALSGVEWGFRGIARDVVAVSEDGNIRLRAHVRVISNVKGRPHGRYVTVWTQGTSAACGYTFQEGVRVVFGLHRESDGRWWTNSCTMNSLNSN